MKTAGLVALLVLSLAQAARAAPTSWSAVQARMDAIVPGQLRSAHVPGALIVVVKDGQVVLSRGYGFADLEARRAVDPDRTAFRAASVSKVMVWTALMQLVQDKRVRLDDDVNLYLTRVKVAAAYDRPVTIANLLSHTAGFEDEGLGTIFLRDPRDKVPLATFLADHAPKRVRPPGEAIAYSNYGAALGALIVEDVSGQSYEAYVQRHIFAPLGMKATFAEPLPPALEPTSARGYRWDGVRFQRAGFEAVGNWAPAGAMSASGGDMARWMNAMMPPDAVSAELLSPQALAQMWSPLKRMHPKLPGVAHGLFETQVAGRAFIEHSGDIETFHTQVLLRPQDRLGIYVAFNSPGGVAARKPVVEALVEAIYGPAPPSRRLPRQPWVEAGQWSGTYLTARRNQSTMAKAFRFLFGQPVQVQGAQGAITLREGEAAKLYEGVGDGLFQSPADGELISFQPSEGGRIYLSRSSDATEPLVRLSPRDDPKTNRFIIIALLVGGGVLTLYGASAFWPRADRQRVWRGAMFVQGASLCGAFASAWWALNRDGVIVLYTYIPASLRWLGGLTVLSALAGLLSLACWVASGGTPGRTRLLQIMASLSIGLAVLSIAFFWNWNALGWRF